CARDSFHGSYFFSRFDVW
nr:immunoglobulin heavy chain junction region [Macaca mulatta]